MANGLIGGFGSFGQTQGQQQGNLLGGLFQEQPTRGQIRAGLLRDTIQQFGGNAQQTGGAAVGAGLGMLATSLLGGSFPGEERADKIRRVQNQVSEEQGIDFATDPQQAFTRTAELFQNEGMPAEAMQAMMQARQFAPEPQELPAAAQTLLIRAQEGGLEPGTPEYEEFMRTGGTQRAPTQTEQQIQYYQSQGMTEREARDLAYGQIQLDSSGRLVNISGGPVPNRVPDGYTPPPLGSVSEADTTVEPTAEEPQGMLESPMLTGFLPFLRRGFESVAGQLSDSAFYPELNRYKTRLRTTERQLVSAWATSSRPPLIEQEKLAELFPGLGPLESPRAARVKLEELGELLLNQRQADLQDLNNPEMSPSLRTEIQKRINATERTLRLLDPEATERGSITTFDKVTPEQAQSVLSGAIRNNTIPSSATLSAYDSERGGFYILDGGEIVRDPNGNPYFIDQGN